MKTLLAAILALTFIACTDATVPVDNGPVADTASFALIQQRIFARSCALSGCHVTGSPMAEQSGLVLEASVAYANLVGAIPTNANARLDGMLRVRPDDPEGSLLFHKVDDVDDHHGQRYGNPMPFGMTSLSVGQIEYIRQWIIAGAPDTGVVADKRLLDDTTRPSEVPFTPLPRPVRGYQLTTGEFTVAPNFERELFIYRRVGNSDTAWVNRFEIKMRRGSHHLQVLTFRPGTQQSVIPQTDVIRDIRNADGTLDDDNTFTMAYHQFFAGSMTQYNEYRFPPGVALAIAPGAGLDMNSHYANKSDAPMTGEAFANFHTVDRSQVQHIARSLTLGTNSFTLPPGVRTTVTRTHTMTKPTTIFLLTSHTHKLGEEFLIKISGGARDGEVVYRNTDWQHPLITIYDTPIVLKPGEGLTSVVTYNNTTDHTVGYGLTSEDEMDIIFGYYY